MVSKSKEIFCSVHGYITLTPLALKFVDTVEFQRLNSLHQLGASFLIFSSASHTRKSHALGVYHLARTMALHLQHHHGTSLVSDRMVELIGLAGLTHDIGHFAFSHVGDIVLARLTTPMRHHEKRSEALVEFMVRKYSIDVTADEIQLIQQMINPPKATEDWRFQIVSGTIDVDRCDYVVRDSQNVGVMTGFGLHHVHHIISHSRIVDGHLAFHPKVARDCHDLLVARRDLHYKVYQHRVSVAIEVMLTDVFHLVEVSHGLQEAIHDINKFTAINDGILMNLFFDERTPKEARLIIQRIWDRSLYTCVGELDLAYKLGDAELGGVPDGVRIHARWVGMDTSVSHPMDEIAFTDPISPRFWAEETHRHYRVSCISTSKGNDATAAAFFATISN